MRRELQLGVAEQPPDGGFPARYLPGTGLVQKKICADVQNNCLVAETFL